jgi:hypothetical protein
MTPRLITVVAVLWLAGAGCVERKGMERHAFRVTEMQLYKNLMSDRRDYIYYAMAFVGRQGGPSIPEGTNILSQWQEARAPSLRWLKTRPPSELPDLDRRYLEFRRTSSPRYGI